MSDHEVSKRSRSRTPVEENGSANGAVGEESPPRRSRDRKASRSGSRSYSRSRSRDRSNKRSHRHRRRSHSRSRSRSRTPRRSSRRHHHSRSRSRSDSRDRYRRRSRSRSPMSSRKRHVAPRGNFQDEPPPSRCVGVFGMSLYSDEKTLSNYFSQFGKIDQIQLVYDKKTGRSRGFGFIYYENVEDAVNAKERAAGSEIDGHRIRVDFSITKRPHTPTPGIYMGKPTRRRDDFYSGGYRGRSPSPYHSRRGRSRDRSYS